MFDQSNIIRASLLVCSGSLLGTAIPAASQQTAASQRAAMLDEVVVTAQRREERLQDAPLSVVALSGDDMHERGIASIKDLADGAVPSVRMAPFFGRASAIALSMRGIASGDVTQISRDPSFGIYIDGVYLGRVQGLGTDLIDVERMEVLRGPQGTLFGRNAVGGALNIVSRQPAGVFALRQRASVGNLGARNLSTSVDLPEFAGISIKIDGLYAERDGWVNNDFEDPGQSFDYNYMQKQGLRIAALWEPTDRLDVLYAYDTSRDRQTSAYPHIDRFVDDRPVAPIVSVEPSRVREARFGAPLRPSRGAVEGHTLTANYALSDSLTLRSISSYRELEQSQQDQWAGSFFGANFAGLGLTGRLSVADVEQDQFSQELQLLGSTPRLEYVVGAFYFEEDGKDSADTIIPQRYVDGGTAVVTLDPFIVSPSRSSLAKARSRALFGQMTWTPPVLEDRLDVTVGLRYTDDKKSGALTSISGAPPEPPLEFRFSNDRVDPLVVLAYRFSDELSTYLRWSTAYRAGGANSRSASFNPFDEEEVMAWELGVKSEFWDRRARLNLAAFHMDYDDQQFTFTSPLNPSISETVNIPGTVKIRGLEADLQLAPVAGLLLNASYTYTDVDSPAVTNPFPPNPVFQPRGGLTPKHAASGAIDYQFEPTRLGTLRTRLDVIYSSSLFVSSLSSDNVDSRVLVNGRVVLEDIPLRSDAMNLELALWGRNLFDRKYTYFDGTLDAQGFSGARAVWYGLPRTFGLELTLRM